ncbi:MAG TPA: hypothetical protein VM219_09085 [Phycisphaerae bacterium]|nr:hypothetical protein [Phycisphaerae bacterium]HUX02978.1 hypothetical protein [Phycisphaerae bacterium]
MALKRVRPGERLRIPADAYNAFVEAAQAHRGRQQGTGAERPARRLESRNVVPVKNTSGADQDRFAILGIDVPIFTPTDNLQEFQNRPALKGIVPTTADHAGRFVVLLEPAKADVIVPGLMMGVTPVQVNITDENHQFADVADGETGHLESGVAGAAQILWREGLVEEEEWPQVKWAVVRVSNPAAAAQLAIIHGLKVTGVWTAWGEAWTDFDTHGYITFVSGKFAFLDKSWVDEESDDLFIKVTGPRGKNTPIGYRGIAVNDFIGWAAGDYFEDIPDSGGEVYDGEVVAFVGPEGALLNWGITAGKGLVLDNPVPYDRKIHVELEDTTPGLKFDEETDNGQLMVDPNTDKGITVGAAGVEAKINDGVAGLRFGGEGNIEVKPDATRGIDVAADGVRAKLAADGGLQFDGAGDLAVKPKPDAGIVVDADGVAVKPYFGIVLDANGVAVKPKPDSGIVVDVDGVAVKPDAARAAGVDASGLHVRVPAAGSRKGVIFTPDGELGAHVNMAVGGIMVDDDGLAILVNQDKGISVDGNGVFLQLDSVNLDFAAGDLTHIVGPHVYGHETNLTSLHGISLDANGHVRKVYAYEAWIGPAA